MRAVAAGAEDCLCADLQAPRALVLATRRAVMRLKRREAQLPAPVAQRAQAEPQQVTLVQETSDAIVLLDSQGQVRFATGAAAELHGRKNDVLIGQPFGLTSAVGEQIGRAHV